ncbi:MAG: 3-deoxy-D-manno-octulosonic acid transferase [Kiritimatiellae bacterium]|nr:3-deoxy-D-manno-octulosonic acid transferase [Kiritimatiellia bacterium]
MKWVLYNLAFAIAFPFMLPGFLARMLRRGGYGARMGDRFALYPPNVCDRLGEGGRIWVHAVSVGEVQVALQLVRAWREVDPSVKFCFSTTSSTGWRTAEAGLDPNDVLIYNPLDFPNFVKSALKTVKPRAIILTESEIWPVFIRKARKMGIPLFLVNARVSDRSAPRYAKTRWLFKDVFGAFARIFAQSDLDRNRLLAAGAPKQTIEVTGSFKFDVAHRNPAKEAELRVWTGGRERILLGGSTWPGEDAILLDILKTLDGVTLILAPRHFEKADKVEENILAAGFGCIRRSRGESAANPGKNARTGAPNVFLADTTGELMGLYGIADAVFVGKSLCEHGSQNMIEPCLCGKPTVVGPYTENFRPVMSDLLSANAIIQAKDADEVAATIRDWFANGDGGLGKRAEEAVLRRRGVVPKCIAAIREMIGNRPKGKKHGWGITAASYALGLAFIVFAAWLAFFRKGEAVPATAAEYRYEPVRIVSAYATLAEMPEALTFTIADASAADLAPYYKNASLKAVTNETAKADIAVFTADRYRKELKHVFRRVSEGGLATILLDMRRMTVGDFGKILKAVPGEDVHLWMPSDNDWVLVARETATVRPLDAILDLFARETAFEDLARGKCESLPDLFASYVGRREEIAPAVAGDLSAKAKCEYFVPEKAPLIDWIESGATDKDIWEATGSQISGVQAVRREIIKGSMLGVQKRKIEDAYDIWAKAIRKNPNDTMLLSRLHLLAVNASAAEKLGNWALAAKCYETMIAVRPTDAPAIRKYGQAFRNLGRPNIAEMAFRRADELEKAAAK